MQPMPTQTASNVVVLQERAAAVERLERGAVGRARRWLDALHAAAADDDVERAHASLSGPNRCPEPCVEVAVTPAIVCWS